MEITKKNNLIGFRKMLNPLKHSVKAIEDSYELFISNPTDIAIKFTLFDSKNRINLPNFGFDKNIIIKSTDSEKDYNSILKEILESDFHSPIIKFQSEEQDNLNMELTISKLESNSDVKKQTFKPLDYLSACSDEILFIAGEDFMVIDSNYKIEFEIFPKNSIVLTFFKGAIKRTEKSNNQSENTDKNEQLHSTNWMLDEVIETYSNHFEQKDELIKKLTIQKIEYGRNCIAQILAQAGQTRQSMDYYCKKLDGELQKRIEEVGGQPEKKIY